jgi:hypothetical protein
MLRGEVAYGPAGYLAANRQLGTVTLIGIHEFFVRSRASHQYIT